ncbi:sugar fermentation stimulation protein A [Caloramator quimbayensis]|uniref:Sugar fermentation stimulation protein homolog n=1 Tax=Caloramator quimbayensis TaxID=1147123 RepID=A0A1T4WWM8_9CLOT|nr:DNA/RNA nuclease SfsA [Caloramator quimbayensis]SKA81704.1 sugar fermentation stimulation protein A [Caloramator quimbayensis]
MYIDGEKNEGIFIKRLNRFEALVRVDNKIELVHVPNTGRMKELLYEGAKVILNKTNNPNRKTKYSLLHIYKNQHLICVNSSLANRVFEEAVLTGEIDWAEGEIKREVQFFNSRFDFFIKKDEGIFTEVKCATFEEDGIAKFPDAPTERGKKHIDELILANNNYKAAIVIISFMDYVKSFTPNYKIDKEFGEKLIKAFSMGVIVKAYRCSVSIDEVVLKDELKIIF